MCTKLYFRAFILLIGGLVLSGGDTARAELLGWWKLDEGEGTTARDLSGNGNHGAINNLNGGMGEDGSAWDIDPDRGNILSFGGDNASGTYVDAGNIVPELTLSDDFAWAFWAKQEGDGTGGNDVVLGNRFGGTPAPLQFIKFTPTRFEYYNGTHNGTIDYEDLPAGEWVHHVSVKEGANLTYYRNGEEAGTNTTTATIDEQPFYMGGDPQGERWSGRLSDVRLYTQALSLSEIEEIMAGGGATPEQASSPNPEADADDVLRDGTLSWSPGIYAETHDVYFGTNFDDVNEADRSNPGSVLVSQGQADTSYALGRLELGQTYFWRIDEVNAVPDNTIYKGPVWGFTVEPVSYPLPGASITAAASSANRDTTGPEKTIDGSGLDETDGHSVTTEDMWLSATGDGDPWIQYEFNNVYKLDRMLVWNSNQAAEATIGWSLKEVLIETSTDGTTWRAVEDVNQLSRGAGVPGAGPTDDIAMVGVPAKYVRITIINNWGGVLPQYSLSEVRFYYFPVQAREPVPTSGSNNVLPDALLSWRAGREADTHDVFVDTDANAVLDGSAPSQTVADSSFGLASLDLPIGETYYWKVNEVNDAEDPSTWEGPVWNFTIPDPLVVDDFESYNNDIPSRPYVTWRDGLSYSNPAPGGEGNGTGAIVGHDIFSPGSPFFDGDLMELTLIHGGTQSLPLYYDNSGNGGNEPYSEMTRTFSPAQDWSGNAIATLTLYFRGEEDNSGQLYVKINNTKVLYTDDPAAISTAAWTQWNIDLTSVGGDVSSVQSLSIGIENPGSGLVYVDDILLYRNAPAVGAGD